MSTLVYLRGGVLLSFFANFIGVGGHMSERGYFIHSTIEIILSLRITCTVGCQKLVNFSETSIDLRHVFGLMGKVLLCCFG